MQTLMNGVRGDASDTEMSLKASQDGGLYTAEILAPYALITRQGKSFTAISTTPVAALVDEPTTATNCIIYNNSKNLYYVIERIFANQDVSAAAQCRWALWACVQHVGRAADTAGITLYCNMGGQLTDSTAIFDPTATAVDEGWSPWSNGLDVEPTGILGGSACSVRVDGLMVIPPTGGLALHVVASDVGATFNCGAQWSEVLMD